MAPPRVTSTPDDSESISFSANRAPFSDGALFVRRPRPAPGGGDSPTRLHELLTASRWGDRRCLLISAAMKDDDTVLDPEAGVTEMLGNLRTALRDAVDSVAMAGAMPGARSLGRLLGVDRMTGWRCLTVMTEEDPKTVLRAMPGRRGWQLILDGLERAGATDRQTVAIRREVRRLEEALLTQGNVLSTRSTAMLSGSEAGSATSTEAPDQVELRRRAMDAAVNLYGVRSTSLVAGHVLAPGREAATISLGAYGLINGLRCLRTGPGWPIILRPVVEIDEGRAGIASSVVEDGARIPGLLPGVSSSDVLDHLTIERGDGPVERVLFSGSPSGPDEGFRVAFADAALDLPVPATASGREVDLMVSVLTPSSTCVVEFLVHRDLRRDGEPMASLVGTPLEASNLAGRHRATRLPLDAGLTKATSWSLPRRVGPLGRPRKSAIDRICTLLGMARDEFDLFRCELEYPPLFGALMVSCRLDWGD